MGILFSLIFIQFYYLFSFYRSLRHIKITKRFKIEKIACSALRIQTSTLLSAYYITE